PPLALPSTYLINASRGWENKGGGCPFFCSMKLREMPGEAIGAVAERRGCRLLAVEGAGVGRFSVVRVVLERSNGESVTVEECEHVSRDVSALLDATDEIPHRYTLEGSSAGPDRKPYSLEAAAALLR